MTTDVYVEPQTEEEYYEERALDRLANFEWEQDHLAICTCCDKKYVRYTSGHDMCDDCHEHHGCMSSREMRAEGRDAA